VARRRIEVNDVVEVLVQWQTGRRVKQIARSTGLARNTVRKYLAQVTSRAGLQRQPALPRAELWAKVSESCPELVDRAACTELAAHLRELHAEIVAGLKESTAMTVWQRLRDAGRLSCSIASFRRYLYREVREVDPQRVRVRRPEPKPGTVAEIDFGVLGHWTDPVTGRRRRLWAFVMVLGASRHLFVRPVWRLDLQTWIQCHVEAFSFFDSVPRRLVVDNLKDGVVRPSLYDPKLNRTYAELAEHYRTLVDPCRSQQPTDKPVVERSLPYVRDSFWSGRTFASFEEIVAAATTWCREVAGQREHRTLRARPLEVFEETERRSMLPLPETPFEIVRWFPVTVHRDIHFHCDGALYSAPWRYVGRELQARQSERLVELFDGAELVKLHARVASGKRQTDWSDYPEHKAAFFVRNADWCRQQARLLGPHVTAVVDALLDDSALHHLRQAQAILRLADTYPAARVEAACRLAASVDGQYQTVRNLLRTGRDQLPAGTAGAERANTAGAFLHGADAVMGGAAS
jgi:transposase